ncbi:MAG: TetR/AcrR family transcriptional regulator [Candidatus Dadabacteria bacterium]|nr:MAG: TetR/AcrR family transcriptional regulator [Candidatus Dadabacteria bacterium]
MEDRARRIVRTAVELAEKGGFEAVRLRDVAASANVALGTLYRHFRSKEDLLVAALAEEVEQLERYMASHPARGSTPRERVASFFGVATRGLCRRPMLAQAVLRAATSGQPELAEKVASFHGRMTTLITNALRGNDGETATERAGDIALVLEFVWFASLVGWGGGLHDQDTIVSHMRTAASLMLP